MQHCHESYMLIITNEVSSRVSRKGRLACSRESKEQGSIALIALVRGRVEREDTRLGHEVVHNGEDALFHLASVLCSENDHLSTAKVDGDRGGGGHAGGITIGREGTRIKNGKVGFTIVLELFVRGTDQHIAHEETVVGSGTDHSDLDSLCGVEPNIPQSRADPQGTRRSCMRIRSRGNRTRPTERRA